MKYGYRKLAEALCLPYQVLCDAAQGDPLALTKLQARLDAVLLALAREPETPGRVVGQIRL
ncbi:MAG TPA: hypothetical protein VM238_18540 [Phycisphaerae bacterium]|nr:hypothetical protein [Phycisphaerae bacterium]